MSYAKQTWDTTSYVNPTRMNHIEDGIDNALPKDSGGTVNGDVSVDAQNGTTSIPGFSLFEAGNNIPEGTAKNSAGVLRLHSKGSFFADLMASNITANRDIFLPNKSGTVALASDIVNISKVVNSSNTSVLNIQLNPTNENIIHCLLISNLWDNTLAGCYVGVIQIRKNNNSCAILDLIPTPNTYVKPVPTFDNSTNKLTLTFDNATARFLTLYYG